MPKGPRLKLDCPEVAAVIEEVFRREKAGPVKDRLRVIRCVARGNMSRAEIAEECGCSLKTVGNYLRIVRSGGLEALLDIAVGGRPEGWRKNATPEIIAEFEAKLANNEFVTLQHARRWLLEKHRLDLPAPPFGIGQKSSAEC